MNGPQCKCSWNGDAIKIFEKRNIVILGAKFGNAYVFSPDRHNCILGAVGAWAGLWQNRYWKLGQQTPSVGTLLADLEAKAYLEKKYNS